MFSTEQKIWIVRNFKEERGLHQLRRDFIRHYNISNHKVVPLPHAFGRVISRFEKSGDTGDNRKNNSRPTSLSENQVTTAGDYFTSNPGSSIRSASIELEFPRSSLHRTITKKLKFKPYKCTLVQTLKPEHQMTRKKACEMFLKLAKETVGWQRKIIFSDEKWFSLKPHPNRKNDVYWSKTNPNNIHEVKDQGAVKIMAWVGIVDGQVLPVHWFQGSVTGQSYLDMLKNVVWPAVRGSSSRKEYWFQQDGARVHTTNDVKKFLTEKFHGRVISNGLEVAWPAKSPDLNPLDFYFWGAAESKVHEEKPKTVEDLKEVVETFSRSIQKETLWKVADNFMKRVQFCFDENGGHFQHLLKKK